MHVLPDPELYLPAAHPVQTDAPAIDVCPIGHAEHAAAPTSENFPAGQGVAATAPELTSLLPLSRAEFPAGTSVH